MVCEKELTLGSKAKLEGTVVYQDITVEKGARIEGKLKHISRLEEGEKEKLTKLAKEKIEKEAPKVDSPTNQGAYVPEPKVFQGSEPAKVANKD